MKCIPLLFFCFILGCKTTEVVDRRIPTQPTGAGQNLNWSPLIAESGVQPTTADSKNQQNQNGAAGSTTNQQSQTTNDDWSNGSGGQKGRFEGSSPAGARFIINVPQDNSASKAHGLLVLLHGSGASSYQGFVDEMGPLATRYGLIPVSVLAPDGQSWNQGVQAQNATYLHDLIQNHLYTSYNIDKRKIIFSGQSSGGGFLSTHFVATYGKDYRGGAFMQCGMQPPTISIQTSPNFTKDFKLHFEVTRDDQGWLSGFAPSVNAYRQAGLTVSEDRSKAGGHCGFSQSGVIADYIEEMLPTN